MTDVDPEILHRRWVHSHEEDTGADQVFRPASYSFPPSRGRSAFDLHPDGSYGDSGPGPTDKPEQRGDGTWKLEGDKLELHAGDGTTRVLKIESASPDRLVVRP
jgi:lipocalin-like protein